MATSRPAGSQFAGILRFIGLLSMVFGAVGFLLLFISDLGRELGSIESIVLVVQWLLATVFILAYGELLGLVAAIEENTRQQQQ